MNSCFSENNSADTNIEKKDKKEVEKIKTYRPLTTKQVKTAELRGSDDSVCYIDNEITTDMAIIGAVRSIIRHDSYTIYTIEDGSGVIDTLEWINNSVYNEDMMSDEVGGITLDSYIRVSGRIRFLNGKPQNINSLKVSVITDFNEITYHLLDAIQVHLSASKLDPMSIMAGFKKGVEKSKNDEALVRTAIHECSNENGTGAYIHSLLVHLKEHLPEPKVVNIIKNLVNQGEIFYTFDNEHIKLAIK